MAHILLIFVWSINGYLIIDIIISKYKISIFWCLRHCKTDISKMSKYLKICPFLTCCDFIKLYYDIITDSSAFAKAKMRALSVTHGGRCSAGGVWLWVGRPNINFWWAWFFAVLLFAVAADLCKCKRSECWSVFSRACGYVLSWNGDVFCVCGNKRLIFA